MLELLIASIVIAVIAALLWFTQMSAAVTTLAGVVSAIFAVLAIVLILFILAGISLFAAVL